MTTEKHGVSIIRIRPFFLARLRTLFSGAEYRCEIAHSGAVDKIVVYLNDREIGRILPDA